MSPIHSDQMCSPVTGAPPQNTHVRVTGVPSCPVGDDDVTQETRPAKGKPVMIPLPAKDDVTSAFRKVAKARAEDDEDE